MKKTTRAKAIRLKCLDCCCGSFAEVRRCTASKCPLFPFRMGYKTEGVYHDTPGNIVAESLEKSGNFDKE